MQMLRSLWVTQKHSVHSESEVPVSCPSGKKHWSSATFRGILILEAKMKGGARMFRGEMDHWEDHGVAKIAFRVGESIDLWTAS
jgi:hypothetical protein